MAIAARIRSLLLDMLLAVVVLALLPAPAHATQIGLAQVLEKFTIKNTSAQDATDFHMKIHSDHEKLTVKSISGGAFDAVAKTGEGTQDVTLDFGLGTVPSTKENTFEVILAQLNNEIHITNVHWTGTNAEGQTVALDNAKIPGFKVVGDPLYTIFNDLPDAFGVRGLQFLVNVPELADALLIPGSTPGFGSTLPDFILPPGGSMTFDVPGTIDPGNFMYAQGLVFDLETNETTGAFIDGHQSAPVPEPTTLLLLGSGLAAVVRERAKRRTRG